jgi:hypothetical protein
MTMNLEELQMEFNKEIEQIKAKYNEKFKALEKNKEEFELTYPANNSTVYYVDSCENNVDCTAYYEHDNHDINKFETGFYFKTKAEAKRSRKERILLVKIRQFAEMKNDGWRPNWDDRYEGKFNVSYSIADKKLFADCVAMMNHLIQLPYFKSREIAQECIDLFGDEILEVLINKNAKENDYE